MARNIVVAAINGRPGWMGYRDDDAAWRAMMDWWDMRVKAVLPDRPDLILTPELSDEFSGTGGLVGQSQAAKSDRIKAYYLAGKGRMMEFWSGLARRYSCYIGYSHVSSEDEGQHWQNCLRILDRRGNLAGTYLKNYPTINSIKDGQVCGHEAPNIACDFGTVAGALCFDLNFDELRRRYVAQRPDLILFSSMFHGGILQSIWAFTIQAYLVSAMTEGGLPPAQVVSPFGEVIARSTQYRPFVVKTINLDYDIYHLDFNRARLAAAKMKYGKDITIHDPGNGRVLLQSESPGLTSRDVEREFQLEPVRAYLSRAEAFRNTTLKEQPLAGR